MGGLYYSEKKKEKDLDQGKRGVEGKRLEGSEGGETVIRLGKIIKKNKYIFKIIFLNFID